MKVIENLFKKNLMVKNSFIDKTYWQFQCVPTTYVTENKEENYFEKHFPSTMSIVCTSFKHPKLPISIKITATLLQIVYICMTALSPNSSS